MTHEEKCGPDQLTVVFTHYGAQSEFVVRWCPQCGAVVVDEDYDGRTIPGGVRTMQFPSKLAAAERERDELRKDKERLDKAERLLRLNTWPPFSTPGAPFKYFVFGPVISGCMYPAHESLRAAIDAALEAKRGQ